MVLVFLFYDFVTTKLKIQEPLFYLLLGFTFQLEMKQLQKVDLANAILLCKLHDGMFDKGLISLGDDYQILFKDKINLQRQGISTKIKFRESIKKSPLIEYIDFHQQINNFKKLTTVGMRGRSLQAKKKTTTTQKS